jgi:hypothetical protein
VQLKICGKCRKELPESDFNKKELDTLQSYCKKCQKIYKDAYYIKNKKKHCERNSKNRKENKLLIQKIKESKPCTDCGIKYPYYIMDFDHKDDNKSFNVGESKGILKKLKEIEKCDLVCANCHRTRTYNRIMARSSIG